MSQFQRQSPHRGFTLVEMLVVLGIIAVLAALLLPAAMGAVTRARDAAIGFEVNQLASAIESYKQDKGDYPPNFKNFDVFMQHVRRCYPKIAPSELAWFFIYDGSGNVTGWKTSRQMDEGEALVFWLSHTTTDPRYPFGLTTPSGIPTFKRYYEFDESRFGYDDAEPTQGTGEQVVRLPSYRAKHCKDSHYIYIDSRSYEFFTRDFGPASTKPSLPQYAFAETNDDGVRPYWSDTSTNITATSTTPYRDQFKPMNPTTFQLICAGQDGLYGLDTSDEDVKQFPSGNYYSNADKDNITNFSGGRRMEASAGKTK